MSFGSCALNHCSWVGSDSCASEYALVKIDNKGKVLHFNEKSECKSLTSMQVDTSVLGLSQDEAQKKRYIASMGIYVFKKRVLLKLLRSVMELFFQGLQLS
jgi:glucose-1-phosphate adenylyltransferase